MTLDLFFARRAVSRYDQNVAENAKTVSCKIIARVVHHAGLSDIALIAQLAEHALSKRKVTSSNLVGGLCPCWCSW